MAGQSNTTARQLSRLLSDVPGDARQTLQANLDSLSEEAGTESAAADARRRHGACGLRQPQTSPGRSATAPGRWTRCAPPSTATWA